MQIKNILTFALVGLVAAAPADLPTIKNSLTTIIDTLTVLDTAVKSLTDKSDPLASFKDLTAKSGAVLKALQDGTKSVSSTTPITLTEAIGVQPLSGQLNTIADQVVTDFIAKKPLIVNQKRSKEVVDAMQAQSAATGEFVKAISDKLPSAVRSIADASAKKGIESLAVC
jgi:hypothetical protein